MMPMAIRAMPAGMEKPVSETLTAIFSSASSCKNKPKRAMTNPNPISATPVRSHARNVRSTAR
jgi:hypothetical protein